MPFIEFIRGTSHCILIRPGLAVAIDEIMVQFTGRSEETHRIKNKPIGQGLKLFPITDSRMEYVCSFTPDGLMAGNNGRNEYSRCDIVGVKTYNMIMLLYDHVIRENVEKREQFFLFLDKLFTLPKTISELQKYGFAFYGTAKPDGGHKITACYKNAEFNDLNGALMTKTL